MDGRMMDGQMNGWMDGRIDGWTDKHANREWEDGL